jgi:hypothetical protein
MITSILKYFGRLRFILLICVTAGQVAAQSNAVVGVSRSLPAVSLGNGTNQDSSTIAVVEETRTKCIENRRLICGRILRVLAEGVVVDSGYTNLMREPLMRSWLVPGTVTASRSENLIESHEQDALCVGTVFLTDLPKKRGTKPKQYDYVIIRGYPTGEYVYNSVGDIHKTVRRFSASLEKAVKLDLPAGASQTPSPK